MDGGDTFDLIMEPYRVPKHFAPEHKAYTYKRESTLEIAIAIMAPEVSFPLSRLYDDFALWIWILLLRQYASSTGLFFTTVKHLKVSLIHRPLDFTK